MSNQDAGDDTIADPGTGLDRPTPSRRAGRPVLPIFGDPDARHGEGHPANIERQTRRVDQGGLFGA